MTKPTISISFNLESSLTPEEFWPDGVPENWTFDDVLEVLRKERPRRVLEDWGFLDDLTMEVDLIDSSGLMDRATITNSGRVISRYPEEQRVSLDEAKAE